jgi:phospho-N-acetylmuramoyl-pentapeptide-transferase
MGRIGVILLVLLLHMGLGFLDDYLKATRGKALGLKARQKLAGQVFIAVLFVVYLAFNAVPGVTTDIALWSGHVIELTPWLYYPLVVLLMVGMSNSANLADGLDGLATGLALLAFVGLAMTTFSGAPEIAFFGWAMAGSCLGFLIYNGFPASVMMGDTGSLAIGASAAAMAVMGKEELPVLIFFLVFIVETLSVVIQVVSFKTRGKRVFKIAPLHHHFEMCGWREVQVVQRFWIAGAIALWLGLIAASSLSPALSGPIW